MGSLTWIDSVTVNSTLDPSTGQPMTSVSSFPETDGTFTVDNFFDGRAMGGTQDLAIIQFPGPGNTTTLDVTYAAWNFTASAGGSVPLFVYSYQSSPSPPDITSYPTGHFLYEVDIPAGDYSSAPYSLTLSGQPTDFGTALLLETQSSTLYGVPSISFDPLVIGANAVPEPASWLLMAIALVVSFLYCSLNRR